MNITIPIPDDLDEASKHRAEQDVREAAGVPSLPRRPVLRGQLAKFLGIERGRVDEVLNHHAVGILSGVTAKEIADQADTLRRLRERPR